MQGVRFFGEGCRTSSAILTLHTGKVRFIESIHLDKSGRSLSTSRDSRKSAANRGQHASRLPLHEARPGKVDNPGAVRSPTFAPRC